MTKCYHYQRDYMKLVKQILILLILLILILYNNNIEEARNTARAEYVILEESLKNAGKTNTNTNSTSIINTNNTTNTRKNLAY